MDKLSIRLPLKFFFSLSFLYTLHVLLLYGQIHLITSNLCTHDVSMTYVYYAFNVYGDGGHQLTAGNVRLMQGKSEIFLRAD